MSKLERRTYNSIVFEISPSLEILQVEPEKQSGKAMRVYALKHDHVLLDPRIKKRQNRETEKQREFDILSFSMWVGYEVTPAQLYKAIQLAQHYNAPITEFRVESISKHLKLISELVSIHNSLLENMEDTILARVSNHTTPLESEG